MKLVNKKRLGKDTFLTMKLIYIQKSGNRLMIMKGIIKLRKPKLQAGVDHFQTLQRGKRKKKK